MAGTRAGAELVLVGSSHRRTGVGVRERLHVGAHEAGPVALRLAEGGEGIVLSTCNRTEIYLADLDPDAARARSVAELARRARLGEPELGQALYSYSGDEVALHLLRVAAGLDSLVVGEPQILGQVRASLERAAACDAAGPLLTALFRQALHAGKRVRSETGLAARPASIAATIVPLARRLCGDLGGLRVLLIGAGKMSELAAACLVGGGARNVFIASRARDSAAALAGRFGGQAASFERLVEELARADVVVSSTACPRHVVSTADVTKALRSRPRRRLLLVDLAVPRDLEPSIRELPGCELYDLDDLAALEPASDAHEQTERVRAEAIVREEAERFESWRRSRAVAPTIGLLRRQAEEIRSAELARVRGRLGALTAGERRAVETVTTQIVNALLHTPTMRIKEAAGRAEGDRYDAALRHLFALEEVV